MATLYVWGSYWKMNSRENKSQSRHTAVRVCHVARGDLWAGAEVQLLALMTYLVRLDGFEWSVILFNEEMRRGWRQNFAGSRFHLRLFLKGIIALLPSPIFCQRHSGIFGRCRSYSQIQTFHPWRYRRAMAEGS